MDKLCGKCNKPKLPDEPILVPQGMVLPTRENFCKCGRPIEYKEEYIQKVDEYLESNQDEEIQVVKQSSEKYEMFDNKLKVKLPTIEGFALFIGHDKTTLYDWESNYPEFSHALNKIRVEQQKRLINEGLSGNYNSTIAKLILSANHDMREKGDMTSDGKAIKGNSIVFKSFKDEE